MPYREYRFSDGLERISEAAFYECVNLRYVNIPQSVTYIGDLGFGFQNGIPVRRGSITLPSGVTAVGSEAFVGFTVYTQVPMRPLPENYKPQNPLRFLRGCFYKVGNIAYECDIRYENSLAYVYSISTKLIKGDWGLSLDLPVRDGYTFCGWASDEGGEVVYNPTLFMPKPNTSESPLYFFTFDEPYYVALTKDMNDDRMEAGHGTLYAVWQKD